LSISFAKMHLWWHEKHGSAQQRIHWTAGCRSGATLISRARKDLRFRTALLSQRRHRRYYSCEGKGGSERPGRVGHGSSTKTDPTFYRVESMPLYELAAPASWMFFIWKGMLPHLRRQLPGILISCLAHDERSVGSRLWTLQYALSEIT
jgi:hypothetical protein